MLMYLEAKRSFVFINKLKWLLNNLTAFRNPAGYKNDNINIDDHQYWSTKMIHLNSANGKWGISARQKRHSFQTLVSPLRGGKTPNLAGRLTIWRLDRSKIVEGRWVAVDFSIGKIEVRWRLDGSNMKVGYNDRGDALVSGKI